MSSPSSLLSPLGIHGWEAIEPILLASVLLGEPVLMVGEPGSGKTYLGRVLEAALSTEQRPLAYGYYDLSRANFEDIIGFPNPEAFRQGRSEFIHNQTTIWDKQIIMVDEVARALHETSNKWLEVLGVRTLMGQPLSVKVILAGTNPPEHLGAQPLPQAFADRFLAFVRLPGFAEMERRVREQILATHTGLDGPAVGFWQNREPQTPTVPIDAEFLAGAARLRSVLGQAADLYRELDRGVWAQRAERYADLLGRALIEADLKLEARRLKMVRRALLATLAVRSAQNDSRPDVDTALACAAVVARCALPQPYSGGETLSDEQIDAAHAQAAAALRDDHSELELFQAASQAERLALVLGGQYSPTVQEKVCADFLADESLEADMTAWVCGQLILQDEAAQLPAHCLDRLARRFHICEDRLEQTVDTYVEPDATCADQLQAYAQAQQLVERANNRTDTRVACAWALAQSEGDPQRVLTLYPKALGALEQALRELQPLAERWKVPGADSWQPS